MINPNDPRAVYRQIAEQIRDDINQQRLHPGDTVPGVTAICERWAVSNATAQLALRMLKSWGLTGVEPGHRTYVLDRRAFRHVMTDMTFGARPMWRELTAAQGIDGNQEITGAGRAVAPVEVADALGVDPAESVTWRRRLLLLDGDPVQIATSWYPKAIAEALPQLAEPVRLPRNSTTLMAQIGQPIVFIRDRVLARTSTADEAGTLNVEIGAPVTDILRVGYTEDLAVGEVCIMVSDGMRLHAIFESHDSA